jgi:SAM-dependent methyltransferase
MSPPQDFFAVRARQYDSVRPPVLSDTARDEIVRAAQLTRRAPILDIGAGTGRVSIPLARLGLRVIGLDRTSEMLAVLRQKAPDAGVIPIVADGCCLPFEEARFQAVVVARLLYLIPAWRDLLAEAVRVLLPDGHVLHEWANGNPDEPSARIRERLRVLFEEAGIDEPFHPGVRRETDVDDFLVRCGLGIVDIVKVRQESTMTVEEFIDRTANGDFSYTWKAPPAVQSACLRELRRWAMSQFDLARPAFAQETYWKIFARA